MISACVRLLVFALFAVVAVPHTSTAQVAKDLKASDAWVRLPAAGETSTIAVASIANAGMYAIYLVSATSDVAGKVEFRDASKGPEPLSDVTVINYETAYLDPKGIHIYLGDLKRPLTEGETVNITVKTDAGDRLDVAAVVKKQ